MSEENVEIVRRLYAGWERGDLRAADFFGVEIEHPRNRLYWDRAEALEAVGLSE